MVFNLIVRRLFFNTATYVCFVALNGRAAIVRLKGTVRLTFAYNFFSIIRIPLLWKDTIAFAFFDAMADFTTIAIYREAGLIAPKVGVGRSAYWLSLTALEWGARGAG